MVKTSEGENDDNMATEATQAYQMPGEDPDATGRDERVLFVSPVWKSSNNLCVALSPCFLSLSPSIKHTFLLELFEYPTPHSSVFCTSVDKTLEPTLLVKPTTMC